MKFKIVYIHLAILLAFYGCLQDNGNYTYVDPNEVVGVGGIEEMYSITKYEDTLRISPVLLFKLGQESDFSYEWAVNHSAYNEQSGAYENTELVISTDKDLEYVANHEVPYTDLFATFKVIENSTGVAKKLGFKIRVQNAYQYGYYFLTEEGDGNSDLFMVRNNWNTIDNFYEKATGMPLKGKPFGMESYSPSGGTELIIFTSDPETVGAVLDLNEVQYKWPASKCFHEGYLGSEPIVVDWFKFEPNSGDFYTVINGSYHYTNKWGAGDYNPYIGLKSPDLDESVDRANEICWGLSLIHGTDPGTLYIAGSQGITSKLQIDGEPVAVPGECLFMAGEPGKYAFYGIDTYIFTREDGKVNETVINAAGFGALTFNLKAKREFVGTALIDDQSIFVPSYSQRYFYFSSGNKVYKYNFDAPTEMPVVAFELPEGQQISYLKMETKQVGWSLADNKFIVGSYDSTVDKPGSIYYYNPDGTLDKKYEHVCGKVIDMISKL
ncbi:hypothetical protein KDU71_01810 [Carboxylicivirga sediminis]|uniref:PKD-like family protein n=1 Tax=Carboxylicivirga sediminis TaxID=2006564 RepID=A0A941F0J6_9BACT|nr:PKD-like family lipoprotein [Carboxylicivirga sediminis]MBR8534277.1 hypothetical protein [Carboxylicivirga sediminis]